MLGADEAEVTVKFIPLLATPETRTKTLPVVAPTGTATAMLVAFQLVGDAVVPLNVTVLEPCVPPKFVPVIVTDAPTTPDAGPTLVMLGTSPVAALNAAKIAPQLLLEDRVALAAAAPAVTWMLSSAASFAFDAARTLSSIVKSLPGAYAVQSPVITAPRSKSPAAVAALPLFADVPFPCAAAIASSEFVVATPEYSKMAKRSVSAIDFVTVTVLAPPPIFSA